MDQKNNGGPAFPVTLFEGQTLGDGTANGMTLRDYFAAQAVTGFLSTCEREPGGATSSLSAAEIARAGYELADAMLVERAK